MFAKLFELRNKKLKDNKKKGFTLVELIVVLVILAILAALLIPALTGYINKAKEKSIVAETRQAVMAAQTLVDEAYGKLDLTAADDAIEIGTGAVEGKTVVKISDIATLADGRHPVRLRHYLQRRLRGGQAGQHNSRTSAYQ